MSPRGAYIPLHQYPTPSLAQSRLFTSDLGSPKPSLLSNLSAARPSLRSVAVSLATGILLLLLFFPRQQLTWLQQALQGEGIDFRLGFNQLYLASRAGWVDYEPRNRDDKNTRVAGLETWVDKLSDECVEALVARGKVCQDWPKEAARVDAVWTWANGSSDPLLQVWRAEVTAMLSGKVSQGVSMVRAAKRARHFRDHDEFRHSVRSALNAFSSGILKKLHILTPDLPSNTLLRDTIDPPPPSAGEGPKVTPLVSSSRIGQTPQWLLRNSDKSSPPLSLTHHSDFFSNTSNLPTFNSLSIESQFPFLSNVESEFFLYLNDDTFLLGENSLVETDVGSPLLGSVFRVQPDLTVGSTSPENLVLNPEGEWSSLERANWLLDRRFGVRQRSYLAHIPKAMSMPILREIGHIWKEELEQTASSRFRGRNVEFQLPFLATHYTIESHRQALLLSFIVGRIDSNADGSLSISERERMLDELGFERDERGMYGEELEVFRPFRATRSNLPNTLSQAGLHQPRSTSLRCTSMDGYCTLQGKENLPPIRYEQSSDESPYCKIELAKCFGDDFLNSSSLPTLELFKEVAFRLSQCGDCIVARLISTSGSTGLCSFLPDDDDSASDSIVSSRARRPFNLESNPGESPAKNFENLDLLPLSFDSSSRASFAREILRYSYVLGDSKSSFHSMRTPRDTERILKEVTDAEIESMKNLTFLTLNDDFSNDHVSEMSQEVLENFFRRTWPDRSPYET